MQTTQSSAQVPVASEAVVADIAYTIDTGEKLVNETFGPNSIRRRKQRDNRAGWSQQRDFVTRGGKRQDECAQKRGDRGGEPVRVCVHKK